MAGRRANEIQSRSLLRSLAGIRSLMRHLERNGLGNAATFAAVKGPKVARSLPKPLGVGAAREIVAPLSREGGGELPWIIARDAAVMALLYGAGLRISEALAIRRGDAPTGGCDAITVVGKGAKTRTVPVIEPVRRAASRPIWRLVPYSLPPSGPLFRRRQRWPAVAAHHPALPRHGTPARRTRPAGYGDAACAPPFFREPPARPRWRPADHPGVARRTPRSRRRRFTPR